MTAAELARNFDKARKVGPAAYMVRCSAHADRNPSLKIEQKADKVLIHCFAGCRPFDVLQSAGLNWADLFPESDRQVARQLARAVHDPRPHPDPAIRAERKLRDWSDKEGRRVDHELYVRNQLITKAEKILERDEQNQVGWTLLEQAYIGLAELEFLADLLSSRSPRDWLEAKRRAKHAA